MRVMRLADEAREIDRAVELINLGARMPLLEAQSTLGRERLLRLYREVQGKSPARGMLPFSTDWFVTWQPNIHSSLFMNVLRYLDKAVALEPVDALIHAYRLYLEHVARIGMPVVLSITRAWRLARFFDAGMLALAPCRKCRAAFVAHAHEQPGGHVCGLCAMPARAGKTRVAAASRPSVPCKPSTESAYAHDQRPIA
jgi:flagellar transcriptional activator FlhC